MEGLAMKKHLTPFAVTKSHVAKISPPVEDDEPGVFRALVSAYGVKDYHGDIVERGAFEKTLHEWAIKGRPLPMVWSHGYHDVDNFIGKFTDIVETDKGLELKGQLDLKTDRSRRIHELMVDGIITEFSWSGEVREYEFLEDDGDEFSWFPGIKILDVDLWEAGPTFKGANPDTELLSIKSNGLVRGSVAKAGRVLSKSNYDALVKARDEITRVLEAAKMEDDSEETPEDSEKSQAANTDDAETAKIGSGPGESPRSDAHVRALLELSAMSQREEN